MSRKWSNICSLSRGPGEASEWYWMLMTGSERCLSPSTVPSFRLTWLTSTSEGRVSASTAKPWFWEVM